MCARARSSALERARGAWARILRFSDFTDFGDFIRILRLMEGFLRILKIFGVSEGGTWLTAPLKSLEPLPAGLQLGSPRLSFACPACSAPWWPPISDRCLFRPWGIRWNFWCQSTECSTQRERLSVGLEDWPLCWKIRDADEVNDLGKVQAWAVDTSRTEHLEETQMQKSKSSFKFRNLICTYLADFRFSILDCCFCFSISGVDVPCLICAMHWICDVRIEIIVFDFKFSSFDFSH